jgi:hypothetical protein
MVIDRSSSDKQQFALVVSPTTCDASSIRLRPDLVAFSRTTEQTFARSCGIDPAVLHIGRPLPIMRSVTAFPIRETVPCESRRQQGPCRQLVQQP